MTRPFTSHCTRIFRAASRMYSLKHFQQNFRGDGNTGDICSGGVRNGVGDRGRGAIERQLADSFGSARTTRVRIFFKRDANRWNVHRSGHDVVGHLGIEHAPFLPDDAFIQSEADALRDAAFDLPRGKHWVDDLADFLHGHEIVNANFRSARVHRNFGDVRGPSVRAVGVALIALIVPAKIMGMFVFGKRFQRTKFVDVIATCGCKVVSGVTELQESALEQRPLQSSRRGLDELPDNHGGARSYGRAAVGDKRSVRLKNFDLRIVEVQSFCGDLREDRVRALTHFGAAGKHAHLAIVRGLNSDFGSEVFLARAGKARTVEKGGETDAFLDHCVATFLLKSLALGVIAAELEGAVQQEVQVDLFTNDLIHGERLTFMNEIAAAQLVGSEADGFSDAVQVAFQSEDALRRAESAKSTVRRRVGSDNPATNAHIRAMIRTRGVNGAARENHRGKRFVSTSVEREVDVHGEEAAVATDSGAMTRAGGMAIGGGGHIFCAVIDDFYGLAGLPREQRGVASDHRRIFFFATEAAPGLGLYHANAIFRQPK